MGLRKALALNERQQSTFLKILSIEAEKKYFLLFHLWSLFCSEKMNSLLKLKCREVFDYALCQTKPYLKLTNRAIFLPDPLKKQIATYIVEKGKTEDDYLFESRMFERDKSTHRPISRVQVMKVFRQVFKENRGSLSCFYHQDNSNYSLS
jgi:hypothetical protein